MILDYFVIYYVAFFISGIVFTYPAERKENFRKKLLIFSGIMLLLAVAILKLPRENVFLMEICFMTIGFGLNVIMLHTCFEVSWSVAIYNMVWGVSI